MEGIKMEIKDLRKLYKVELLVEGNLTKEKLEEVIYERLRNFFIEENIGDLNLLEIKPIEETNGRHNIKRQD
jgi:hypothetical protein